MKILIITGESSYPIIKKVIQGIKSHDITIEKAPVSISAFLSEEMTKSILKNLVLIQYDLILLPGFVQWNTGNLEKELALNIKKGPEFASDLPMILNNLEKISLSTSIPANRIFKFSGENLYKEIIKEQLETAKNDLGSHTFYINEETSDLIIGRNLPPPIIAEIVNCTEKKDDDILKKLGHYVDSGADIIDIGCISNKPNPSRVKEIINLIRKNFKTLISIDSMDSDEILAAVDEEIDMILSLDMGNYKNFLKISKNIPIVILPTNIGKAYFPKDPNTRIENLFKLTNVLQQNGFKKLIADPLLETPISPGICNSLETYFLYAKKVKEKQYKKFELPMFFGISNVVELMDIDSVGINGLLASIAIELDIGVLFTVEHSTKLMGGVAELKECIKLNYIAKNRKSPPINLGTTIFKAKGKTSQENPEIDDKTALVVEKLNILYEPDESGYFKIYINHYNRKIYVLHFSNDHILLNTVIGNSAEAISKKIIKMNLSDDIYHINYLGRELAKAENCLFLGKPYIQDE
ncbi:MAG: dihydropteroate synthase-like protein [Promethearchaeota archaeon]|nr:MAG: dihydropteroate synthase-like protein [Candidatus Lokiarchaeota archaeon]